VRILITAKAALVSRPAWAERIPRLVRFTPGRVMGHHRAFRNATYARNGVAQPEHIARADDVRTCAVRGNSEQREQRDPLSPRLPTLFNEPPPRCIIEIECNSILPMEELLMRMWMRPFAFTAVLALGAAACEDGVTDTNAFDDDALLADVALVAADGMFQDLAHMESPTTWAGMGWGMGFGFGVEIDGSRTFTKTINYFDAAGLEQSRYDPGATASMHVSSHVTRDVNHTFWTASIERQRDMILTGMEGAETEVTWNGTSSGDVERSAHPEADVVRTYDMTSSAVITNVVRGVPRADNPYPKSGVITRTIHAVLTIDGVQEVRNVVATITFDGDNTATMTVDNESWEINLDDWAVRTRFQCFNP